MWYFGPELRPILTQVQVISIRPRSTQKWCQIILLGLVSMVLKFLVIILILGSSRAKNAPFIMYIRNSSTDLKNFRQLLEKSFFDLMTFFTLFLLPTKKRFLALESSIMRFHGNKRICHLICKISDNFYFSHFLIWWLFLPGDFLHPSEEAFFGCRILIFEISSK